MSQSGSFFGGGTPLPEIETLTGNSGGPVGPDGAFNLNILGSGFIDVAGNPGTNTLTITVNGTLAEDFVTDSGTATPVANVLNVIGGATAPMVIPNINTIGSGNTLEIALNNTIFWPMTNAAGTEGVFYIDGDRWIHTASSGNSIFIGPNAGNFAYASVSTGIGINALQSITSGYGTALGYSTLFNCTTGAGSIALGNNSLLSLVSGDWNMAWGQGALWQLLSGHHNIVIGPNTGVHGDPINRGADAYVGGETANIIINNIGVAGESNTIRIGTTGNGLREQDRCFIAGIDGVNVGAVATVVSKSGDQLGSTTITAGSGITVTPGASTITISSTGADILAYTNVAVTPFTVLVSDEYLSVDCSGGIITVRLPNVATLGKVFIIKDRTGSADTNNISVTTVGGAVTIDGVTTYTMNTQYSSIQLIGNGSSYEIF